VLLDEQPLACCLFNGDKVSEPNSVLFSDRPDADRAALEHDKERAGQDFAKILWKFAINKNIQPAAG
jgi:hypothetical protein